MIVIDFKRKLKTISPSCDSTHKLRLTETSGEFL